MTTRRLALAALLTLLPLAPAHPTPIFTVEIESPLFAGTPYPLSISLTMPPGETLWDAHVIWTINGPNDFVRIGTFGETTIMFPSPGLYNLYTEGFVSYSFFSLGEPFRATAIGYAVGRDFTVLAAATPLAVPGPAPGGLPLAAALYFLWRRKNAY